MTESYSLVLQVAIGAIAATVVLRLLRRRSARGLGRAARVALVAAPWVGAAALTVAVTSHAVLGHGATSPEPMGVADFARGHPVVVVLAVALAVAGCWPRPRRLD